MDKGTEKVIERVNKIETFKGAIEKRAEESLKGKIMRLSISKEITYLFLESYNTILSQKW